MLLINLIEKLITYFNIYLLIETVLIQIFQLMWLLIYTLIYFSKCSLANPLLTLVEDLLCRLPPAEGLAAASLRRDDRVRELVDTRHTCLLIHRHTCKEKRRLSGLVNGWLDGRLAGWLAGWLVGWVGGWVSGWLDGWLFRWVAGWMGGWLTGWMIGWSGVGWLNE
jgi:hypothetical protein